MDLPRKISGDMRTLAKAMGELIDAAPKDIAMSITIIKVDDSGESVHLSNLSPVVEVKIMRELADKLEKAHIPWN